MLEQGSSGAHPIDVAAQGINLAVVSRIAKGLGQVPGREGVGAVALMNKGNGADETFVSQFRKEGVQLL